MVTMCGWFSAEAARASLSSRATRSGSRASVWGSTLSATSRPRRQSRARYTSPMPPAPSEVTISYLPSRAPEENGMARIYRKAACMSNGWISGAWLLLAAATASAQPAAPTPLAPGQNCAVVTEAHADASAGTANINHDGSSLPGIPAPDISRGFQGIPRSAQPRLTASQQRILECTYHLAEANADMPYTLFVPSSYAAGTPA